jgi:DNA-binding phage protein
MLQNLQKSVKRAICSFQKIDKRMTTKKRIYRDFQELLLERLKNSEDAMAYLNAALADEDERIFLIALRDVWEAQGGDIAALAED